jgi:hypothetical protein
VLGKKGWIDVASALMDPQAPAPCAKTLTNLHLKGYERSYDYAQSMALPLRQACPRLQVLELN